MKSILNKNNKKEFKKDVMENGEKVTKYVKVRYDDECGNGYNSFAITCDTYKYTTSYCKADRYFLTGGCDHDSVKKYFPELAKYIKWHLMNSTEPMHYIANTVYLAGDKDYNGLRKGETRASKAKAYFIYFNNVPIKHKISKEMKEYIRSKKSLDIIAIEHNTEKDGYKFDPKYTFKDLVFEWHECPFDEKEEAENFKEALEKCKWKIKEEPNYYTIGKGKAPELEAARSTAIWPEATLEQLQDEKALKKRLPGLIKEFQKDLKEIGFVY